MGGDKRELFKSSGHHFSLGRSCSNGSRHNNNGCLSLSGHLSDRKQQLVIRAQTTSGQVILFHTLAST